MTYAFRGLPALAFALHGWQPWMQLPETPRRIKGDAAGEITAPADGKWSDAIRERYADRVEVILARHIGASTHPGPGLAGGSGFLLAQSLK